MIFKFKFLVSCLLIWSCSINKKINTVNYIQEATSTHVVKNNKILEILEKEFKSINKPNSLYDIILVKIKNFDSSKNVYIKTSNFKLEQSYCWSNNRCHKPSGYLNVNNVPVLLYGDLDTFFDQKSTPKDILKSKFDINSVFDMDAEYKYYAYSRDTIYGEIQENFEFKGKTDEYEVDLIFDVN